jgi:hypothetical protein
VRTLLRKHTERLFSRFLGFGFTLYFFVVERFISTVRSIGKKYSFRLDRQPSRLRARRAKLGLLSPLNNSI